MLGAMMHRPLLLSSLIDHAARRHGDAEIVSVETVGAQIDRSSWRAVAADAKRLASLLERRGLTRGDRVATLAWNNRRHLELYYGVAGAGFVCHTINPRLTPEHIAYIVKDAQDKILFFDRTFLPIVAGLVGDLPSVQAFVLMGPREEEAAAAIPGLQFYDEILADEGDAGYFWPDFDENSASSLCYTSGTTGMPKGVLYSHRSTILHALGVNQPDGLGLRAADVVMPVVPMFHVNAWGVPYIGAIIGCKLVMPGPNLDGASLAKLIAAENVTVAFGVPTIWMGLLGELDKTGAKLPSLERTVVGGSAAPPSMIAAFRDKHGVELVHAWGMTETSPIATVNQLLGKHAALGAEEKAKLRAAQGRPVFGVELRIVDDEGEPLPEDGATQGKLQIRGHWIVSRYFGQETEASTGDGWFDTGDVSTIDPDGFMVIRDRAKDIVKSGGEWISTVELENIAMSHPAVASAAAIAARHPKWDERPVVIVQKRPGKEVSEEELIAWYDGKVAKWQKPDRAIFVEALPLGGTGKVLKNRLREDFGDVLIREGGA